ncbi:ABC transporter ATP-binding protein [Tissierellaceae bacterium HCP3S3_D8]
MNAIEVKDLTKSYKNGVKALNNFNLKVKEGEIFSLLGENGAGKSTLIKIFTTYLEADSGSIKIFDEDINKNPIAIRSNIACVAQQISIDTHLSLEKNMIFQSRLYKVPKDIAINRMDKLIDSFGLKEYRSYPVSSYSGGIKRRLDIALNMMSNPKILFLDEPTVGMDIKSRMAMWDMIKTIRSNFNTTIFLTTHYLEEADILSDSICIMKDGKEIITGTPLELRSFLVNDTLKISFPKGNEVKKYIEELKKLYPKTQVFFKDDKVLINTDDGKFDLNGTTRFLIDNNIPFYGIEIGKPSLEDVFLKLTEKDLEVNN